MPDCYLFGGPNGAGKTTLALALLPALGVREFSNADLIARGISPLDSDSVAFQAGAILVRRLRELADRGTDFGTESTLSARAFAPFVQRCQERGYRFNLIYVWPRSVELSIARVAARVRAGGHDIPQATIRRRFETGRRNFHDLYLPLADAWRVYDNRERPTLVAHGIKGEPPHILQPDVWRGISPRSC